MTADEVREWRLSRTFELANLKADLLNAIDSKGENLLRIRKARARIDDLRDAIERDYFKITKRLREVEAIESKERKRLEIERLQARIDELRGQL